MPLLVLGDSISAGMGASLPDTLGYGALLHRNCSEHWPQYHGKDLQTHHGRDLPATFLARSGATTADVKTMLERAAPRLAVPQPGPGLAVMTAGGNDFKNALFSAGLAGLRSGRGLRDVMTHLTAVTLPHALDNLRGIVARLRALPYFAGSGSAIYLANVYDPSDGIDAVHTPWGAVQTAGFGDVMAAWHSAYAILGRELGITLVDARTAFLGHGLSATGHATWLSDWIHPNNRGHHEIRRLFLEAMTERPTAGY